MKKQELIHLHGLLAQVQNHYEQQTGDTVDHDSYYDLGVEPTSVHKSKTDHKVAVLTLANGITNSMEGVEEDPVSLPEEYQDVSRDLVERYEEFKRAAHSDGNTYGGGIEEEWGVVISGELEDGLSEALGTDPMHRLQQMERAGLGDIRVEERMSGEPEERFYFNV